VLKGRFEILVSADQIPNKNHHSFQIGEEDKQIVFSQLKRGEIFGDFAAMKDINNPYTVEAVSEKAEYYKIHRSHFFHNFGGLDTA
jgi:CRP-like cAMP-binding protein